VDPGGGSIETWDWVLDHDYCYCYLSYFGFIRGAKVLQGFGSAVTPVASSAIRIVPASSNGGCGRDGRRR
jgi:hypothetical protein